MSKRPGRFFIKVCWHNFAVSTRLTIFSILPAIFISISCVVLNSIGSVGSVVKYICTLVSAIADL